MSAQQVQLGFVGSATSLVDAGWRKSSKSGPWSDNCVETAFLDAGVAVRDSKDPDGPALVVCGSDWTRFVQQVKSGVFA